MFPHRTQPQLAIYLAISVTLLLLGLLSLLQHTPPSYAQSQPEALGSLSGTIRNAQGDPLPNIQVMLEHYRYQYMNRTATTNAQGVYQFLSLQSGIYRLQFQDPQKMYATEYYADAHFADDATTVTVNGNHVTGIDATLGAAGAISLTLQNALPVTTTEYQVRLYRPSTSGTWMIYRGMLLPLGASSTRLDTLPEGTYRLCVEGRNYYSYDYAPLVECYDNVKPDQFIGLAPNATDINVQAGAERAITIVLGDRPQIEGFIKTQQNVPLAGIGVALFGIDGYTQQVVRTDSNGYFSFNYIPNGSYSLTYNYHYFGLNDYLTSYHPGVLLPTDAQGIVVDETTHISTTIRLRRSAQIIGKVTLPGDAPVSWANISLYREYPEDSWNNPGCQYVCPFTLYDPNTGVYTLTNLIGGNFRVRADASAGLGTYLSGFYGGDSLETAADVSVDTGETATGINIIVGEHDFDASIRGTVTANGTPIEGVEVGLFNQSYPYYESVMPLFSTTTDQQGRYSLEGLGMGYYQVGVRDPAGIYATSFYTHPESPYVYEPSWIPVTSTGATENIDLHLTPGGTIRGHIRTQHGQHAGDFSIAVLHEFDQYGSQPLPFIDEKSDANGFFEVTGLPPGRYFLRANTPPGSGEYPAGVSLFYPGDIYPQQILEVAAGQVLEDKDIFVFFTPNVFLPVIGGGTAVIEPEPTPFLPEPPFPLPTPTPDFGTIVR